MVIEGIDYKMESSRKEGEPFENWFFDLYFLKKVNEGKESEREEFKWEGYGCTTIACIDFIARFRRDKLQKSGDTRKGIDILGEEIAKITKELKERPEGLRMEKPVFPPEYYASGLQRNSKKRKKTKEREKIKRNCNVCGMEYIADAQSVKQGIGLCCSAECRAKLVKIKLNETQEESSKIGEETEMV